MNSRPGTCPQTSRGWTNAATRIAGGEERSTLGTALGDWFVDTAGLGYRGSTLVFSLALAILAVLYWRKAASPVLLFWAAFILTPAGAVFGNLFDKPVASGGYGMSRYLLVGMLTGTLALGLLLIPSGRRELQLSLPDRRSSIDARCRRNWR